jgi:hypothetical protein
VSFRAETNRSSVTHSPVIEREIHLERVVE